MTISKKLLISIVTLTTIVLLATLSLARWSFEQGFADFINGLERERLGEIAMRVVSEYERSDGTWEGITHTAIFENVGIPSDRIQRPLRPPPGARAPHDRAQRDTREPQRRGPSFEKDSFRPPSREALPITHLLGVDGRVILQSREASPDELDVSGVAPGGIEISFPIIFGGQTIGTLRSYNQAPSNQSLASEFEQQQLHASFAIGAVSLALALALAFFISHMFVKPIKQLTDGVSKLTEGKYDISLPKGGTDELARLMRDTESLAQTLDQARSQKSRWFADISHELRTPLTILIGEIEAMNAGIRKFDASQLRSIEQEVNLLHRLVDDLYQLSLSDVGALKYEFNETNISTIVSIVASNFQAALYDKKLSIETHITPGIVRSVDAQRFEQLISNLLNNSVKYTNTGGTIRVSLVEENKRVHLIVEDSYPGVPREECEKLFETLYQRNDSRNRSNSGAGLGLAICKNIALSHHASIAAEPSDLGGLKVTVVISAENKK